MSPKKESEVESGLARRRNGIGIAKNDVRRGQRDDDDDDVVVAAPLDRPTDRPSQSEYLNDRQVIKEMHRGNQSRSSSSFHKCAVPATC